MIRHEVTGGGGVRLAVIEAGDPRGRPILFVHGWSQAALSWRGQMVSPRLSGFRLIAFDLRGHAASAAPDDPKAYQDGAHWAADVAAIIAHLNLKQVVLVGWSYGTLVLGDVLRRYRSLPVAGVVTVGGVVTIGRVENAFPVGEVFKAHAPGLLSDDRAVELDAAIAFSKASRVIPHDADGLAEQVGLMMWTRPFVRRSMSLRTEDVRPDFARSGVPLMVVHGRQDRVVVPGQGEVLAAMRPDARTLFMDGIGHAPHHEAHEAFEAALASFALGLS